MKKTKVIHFPKVAVLFALGAALIVLYSPTIGAPGEAESLPANNLSVPVIFAEGIGLTGAEVEIGNSGLRGDEGDTWGEPFYFSDLGSYFMLQQDEANQWQADWFKGTPGTPVAISPLDWSDNLVRQVWTEKSIIRVEVVLFTQLEEVANGYPMQYLYGEKIEEVWGTPAAPGSDGVYVGTPAPTSTATVYSTCARLTIHKLNWSGDMDSSPSDFIPGTFQEGYSEYVAGTYIDSAVYQRYGIDGRTGHYSAEINVAGKIIYGYNWNLAQFSPGVTPSRPLPGLDWPSTLEKYGWYRITFSFDPQWGEGVTRNATISNLDPADISIESETLQFQPVLMVDEINATGNYTYLDVYIEPKKSGKK